MKLLARLALLAFSLLGVILVVEIGLRIAGTFAPFGDPEAPGADAHFIVLCVGDSHTWGAGTGYPARLAERLRNRVPDARVVNLGVPGTNTAQLAARLPQWLDRYRADVVIVWSGANNIWNRSNTEHWSRAGIQPAGFGRRLLDSSKLLRFLRLTRDEQARALSVEELAERSIATQILLDADGTYVAPVELGSIGDRAKRVWHRDLGGRDGFVNVVGEHLSPDEIERVTALDLRAMAASAGERDVPMLVITYPQSAEWWRAPSRGLAAAADEIGLRVISGLHALRQAQTEDGSKVPLFNGSIHPTQRLYAEIGDLVFDALEADGLLPQRASLP